MIKPKKKFNFKYINKNKKIYKIAINLTSSNYSYMLATMDSICVG